MWDYPLANLHFWKYIRGPRPKTEDQRNWGGAMTLQETQKGRIISANAIAAEYACLRAESSRVTLFQYKMSLKGESDSNTR
jgi:hypothetical protein